jgi:hypothetical protein
MLVGMKEEEVSLPLAIARMSQKMHTTKKNRSAGGRYKYATLDHMLNKFHGYSGWEIPLGIYFNERYLGESVYEMECVLYHIDSGDRPQISKYFSTNMLCKHDSVVRCL